MVGLGMGFRGLFVQLYAEPGAIRRIHQPARHKDGLPVKSSHFTSSLVTPRGSPQTFFRRALRSDALDDVGNNSLDLFNHLREVYHLANKSTIKPPSREEIRLQTCGCGPTARPIRHKFLSCACRLLRHQALRAKTFAGSEKLLILHELKAHQL